MNACDATRDLIAFYLDGELDHAERERVARHVGACPTCAAAVEAERAFLAGLREAAPLEAAPPRLRERVEGLLAGVDGPPVAPAGLRRGVERILARGDGSPAHRRRAYRVAAAAAVVLVFALGAWFGARPPLPFRVGGPSEIALMAVDVHQRYARGQLPLEIDSASPSAISLWFDGKVPFGVSLPNYQEASGQERLYELLGARLVGFKGDYAAYVAYRMGARPISLVVTSNSVAMPSGGEQIPSRGLVFHFDVIDGLKVISWSDRGLTYALVSELEERGQQSCVICHQGTKDRDFIETLRP